MNYTLWKANYKSMNLDQLIKEKRKLSVHGTNYEASKIEYINKEICLRYDDDIKSNKGK